MKMVSVEQMREIDRQAIEEYGVPGEILMDRAGYGVARAVEGLAQLSGFGDTPVLLLAGRGNNGGDAFVAARYLAEWGLPVGVWMTGERKAVRGDARTHLNRLIEAGIAVGELLTRDECDELAAGAGDYGVVVDGVLGTGTRGPARGVAAGAILCINDLGRDGPVVSIDVPSGLNADTGEPSGDTVRADLTVTMGFPKSGLARPPALDYVGMVDVVDIGIPHELAERAAADEELITAFDLQPLLPRRARASHKGAYGRVLLIGGAPGFAGAIGLAAGAAVRSGAGLVSVLAPAPVAATVAGMAPEAMVHPADATSEGSLSEASLFRWEEKLAGYDAVLVGPGMTQHAATRRVVERLLATVAGRLVVDADALNVMRDNAAGFRATNAAVVLTPHPGEAGRLLGIGAEEVQADRRRFARELAAASGATVVLKGAGTLVAEEGRALSVNLTGNPGMATGGTGDVLGGLLAGLAAQGRSAYDAARLAAFLHGCAGDEAAWRGSQAALTARDLIDFLPTAFRRITIR